MFKSAGQNRAQGSVAHTANYPMVSRSSETVNILVDLARPLLQIYPVNNLLNDNSPHGFRISIRGGSKSLSPWDFSLNFHF
jgi:hypothetical protein